MQIKKKLGVFIALVLAVSLNTSYIFSQETQPTPTPTTETHSADHAKEGGHVEHKGNDLVVGQRRRKNTDGDKSAG